MALLNGYEHESRPLLAHRWERLELSCCISLQRLTDPAKGVGCSHRARQAPHLYSHTRRPNLTANGPTPSTTPHRCNFAHLVAYAAQHQRCPVFGCDSHLSRKRFVVRDESLRAALAAAAPTPQHQWAWVRGDEVRLSPPDNDDARADPFGQAGSSATAPTSKRQRLVAGVDSLAPSSAGKRRASGQQGSHAAAAAAAKHPRGSSADVAIKMEPEGAQITDGLSEDNSDIYDVERILGERWRGGRAQFLIRWLGCAPPMPRLPRLAACCVLRVR